MLKVRIYAVLMLMLGVAAGWFVYASQVHTWKPFKLGLDLSSGSHLIYQTDTSKIPSEDVSDALGALQGVIQRRVDAFGVSEPRVYTEQGGVVGGGAYRLVVDLPGVTDVNKAVAIIGQTPTLDFKLVKKGMEDKTTDDKGVLNPDAFEDTGLTGELLTGAQVGFDQQTNHPEVLLKFNDQGQKIYNGILNNDMDRSLATFLDGQVIEVAHVNPDHQYASGSGGGVISGGMDAQQAKDLATNLNLGALPVPITLDSTESIGPTLGSAALHAGIIASIMGFLVLSLFLILWYRLPGVVAVVALSIYATLMLVLFQLIPVVLTAAGIAGFVLSVGLAVDANILIAERMKEEINAGKNSAEAIREGFTRAWGAIRDSNIAHIIASIILFWIGTDIIKGFALVFGLGVLVSLFSAITVSRTLLLAIGLNTHHKLGRFLMRSGLNS